MKRGIILILALCTMLVFPLSAYAMTYDVAADDYTSLGWNSYGTNGYNYLPQFVIDDTPSIHVSSFYVWEHPDGWNLGEVGWVVNKGLLTPVQHFAAWERNGNYYKTHLGGISTGTHYYTVRNEIGTNNYLFFTDGVQRLRVDMLGWRYGVSLASSERNTSSDSNWSHNWNLSKINSSGTWVSWGQVDTYQDTDPWWYINPLSSTEYYVQN